MRLFEGLVFRDDKFEGYFKIIYIQKHEDTVGIMVVPDSPPAWHHRNEPPTDKYPIPYGETNYNDYKEPVHWCEEWSTLNLLSGFEQAKYRAVGKDISHLKTHIMKKPLTEGEIKAKAIRDTVVVILICLVVLGLIKITFFP